MKFYQSTRGGARATAWEAILEGIAPDGGLYTPEAFPRLNIEEMLELSAMDISTRVLTALLDGFSKEEMARIVREGYAGKFETDELTPLVKVGDAYVLELFRGPTSAFKDVALSLLPRLMTASRDKAGARGRDRRTHRHQRRYRQSGAGRLLQRAGHAHRRLLPGRRRQRRAEGADADPARRECPRLRCARQFRRRADRRQGHLRRRPRASLAAQANTRLSSANSINLGRLAPQVAYYFKSYMDLVRRGEIAMGEEVNFVVPTGNFGDILAGDFARRMGLPVAKLICASNANNVLTAFIRTGLYDRRRAFHKTASPSMDILVSSNLERYLYLESGRDAALVARLMRELAEKGAYTAPEGVRKALSERFWAGCADDTDTFRTIARVWHELGYLLDTHTAVAWSVYERFRQQDDNGKKTIVLATASPYKFAASVLTALGKAPAPGFAALDETECPHRRAGAEKSRRHPRSARFAHGRGGQAQHAFLREGGHPMKFRVPATTGNTGPGFDSVGLAFTLYARFEAELLPAGQLAISGCEAKYQNEENLAVQAFRAVEKRLGVRPAGLKLHIDTDVPISRGLGSSATLLAAGAFAANALHGAPLDKEMLLDVTTQMEGHPDNAAPALYGGLCASVVGGDGRVLCVRYPVAPSVRFAALIPDFPLATAEARRVLPASIPRADAVFNISRTAILMRGMEMGDYALLSAALDDRLHTPYRKALIHDFDFVRAQALEAGARALVISGAGPTLLALHPRSRSLRPADRGAPVRALP